MYKQSSNTLGTSQERKQRASVCIYLSEQRFKGNIKGVILIGKGFHFTHPSNVAPRGANAACSNANPTGRLGDVGTGLESVVDPINTVILHADEETRGKLRSTGPCVEQGGRGVGKPTSRHQVVRLGRGEQWMVMQCTHMYIPYSGYISRV